MKWLAPIGLGIFLLVIGIIYSFLVVCKDSRKCGCGIMLSVIGLFGIVIGFHNFNNLLTMYIGCISFILTMFGLYLIVKYRQHLRDWVGLRRHNRFNAIFDKIFKK